MVLVGTLGDTLVKELAGTVKFPVQGIKWGSGPLLRKDISYMTWNVVFEK